jgi:hypothetical protein
VQQHYKTQASSDTEIERAANLQDKSEQVLQGFVRQGYLEQRESRFFNNEIESK